MRSTLVVGALTTVVVIAAGVLGACADSQDPTDPTALLVVATTSQTADFVRLIGGNDVTVVSVVAAGIDPHDFEPTAADLEHLAEADLVVTNGLGLEPWFDDAYDQADSDALVVVASTGARVRTTPGGDEDPHVWHDPDNGTIMITNITQAMIAADPTSSADFQSRLSNSVTDIATLDADIEQMLSILSNRKIVTNHDSLGYFIDHYRLELVGSVIPGFDSQAELSLAETNDLIKNIRSSRVKAIFAESSLASKTAEAIAREAGVAVVSGDDALYGDSLGPEGSGADTYLKMMRHNAATIVRHLG